MDMFNPYATSAMPDFGGIVGGSGAGGFGINAVVSGGLAAFGQFMANRNAKKARKAAEQRLQMRLNLIGEGEA